MKAVSWFLLILFTGAVLGCCASADTTDNSTGYLQVSSSPSGALIYLDSEYVGITPDSGGFVNITNLSPREYGIVLKKANYLDYISTVKIVSGETVKVAANLKSATGTSVDNPENSWMTGFLVVIVVLIIVGVVVVFIRRRKEPKKPEKIELD